MVSSSTSGSELADLKEELKGLKEKKAAILQQNDIGPRDRILLDELNKDLDRVQAAITTLTDSGPVVSFTSRCQAVSHLPLA